MNSYILIILSFSIFWHKGRRGFSRKSAEGDFLVEKHLSFLWEHKISQNEAKESLDKNDPNKRKVKEPRFLKRILTGKELLNIFQHVAFIYRDYDEPVNDEECALITDTFQYFSDLIDMYGDLEVSDLIKEGMP